MIWIQERVNGLDLWTEKRWNLNAVGDKQFWKWKHVLSDSLIERCQRKIAERGSRIEKFFKTIRSIFHNRNNNNIEFRNEHSTRSLFFSSFIGRIAYWNIGFCGERKIRGPGVDPRSKDENQQQTKPTGNVKYGNRTQGWRWVLLPLFLCFSLTLLIHTGLKGFN